MDHAQQVSVVKNILDLELFIKNTQSRLDTLSEEEFSPIPDPPVCVEIERTYPEVKTRVKYNWIMALIPLIVFVVLLTVGSLLFFSAISAISLIAIPLFFFALIWPIIYYFAIVKPKKRKDIEEQIASPEYQSICMQLNQQFDAQQYQANMEYNNAVMIYNNQVIPRYQQALAQWTAQHNNAIQQAQASLQNAKSNLESLYTQSMLIPFQYRNIEALQYIYQTISTSTCDIMFAIQSYESNRNLIAQQEANEHAAYNNQLLMEQNEIAEESNRIAEKARRDANIAAVVGTVQRHNTNKQLNNLNEYFNRR